MQVAFKCFSQRGVGKAHNEDAVLLDGTIYQGSAREHGQVGATQPHFFAIADGVSSGTRPRTASRRLLELLLTRLVCAEATGPVWSNLHQVHQDYVALSCNSELRGMASTLVGVRLIGNAATIFNVGDSRAYLLANGQARLLSRDHSVINDMVDDGEITPEQAINAGSFMRSLTNQFTADQEYDEFKVNVVTHQLQPGERLLLCSDGFNEVLSDSEIAALLTRNSDEDLLNACKAPRRNGGTDDFSVIVLTMTT